MKKVLSSLLLTSATMMMFGQAQVLVNENFEALTLGNVGADVTGATAGQGNMHLAGGVAANYQIANIDAANGKSLQVTSGNGAPPATGGNTNTRWVWKEITTAASPANNIIVSKAKIYTGSATGAGTMKLIVYGTTAGVSIGNIGGIKYNYVTKTIQGEAYVAIATTPPGSGVVTLNLGTETFPANTWVDVEHRYNKTTGAHSYLYTGSTGYNYTGGQVNLGGGATATAATVAGSAPNESDLVSDTAAGNTVANIAGIDNWNVQFTNTAALSVGDVNNVSDAKLDLLVYPNPVSDVLNIRTDSKIKAVSVVDMTGKNIKVNAEGGKVDVSALPVGNYLINVETADGISTLKFIKK